MALLQHTMSIIIQQTTIPIRRHHQEAVSWCQAGVILKFVIWEHASKHYCIVVTCS